VQGAGVDPARHATEALRLGVTVGDFVRASSRLWRTDAHRSGQLSRATETAGVREL